MLTLFENMFKYVTGSAGLHARHHTDEVTESSIFMVLTQTIKFLTRSGREATTRNVMWLGKKKRSGGGARKHRTQQGYQM